MRPAELLARVEQLKQNEMDRPVAEKQPRCEPDPIPETLFSVRRPLPSSGTFLRSLAR